MKLRNTALAALIASVCLAAPALQARNENKPHTEKTVDASDNPQVKAAQKVRDDAEKALEDAKAKTDKTAIDAAQKSLDDAEAKLKSARKTAEAAAKKDKAKKSHKDDRSGS